MKKNGRFYTVGPGVPSEVPAMNPRKSELDRQLESEGKGLGWRGRLLLLKELKRRKAA
jgi:hypothetical protein